MEENLIKHYVEVDHHITIELKIPTRLSVLQFKGLMLKADKIFKVSEVPLVATKKTYNRQSKFIKFDMFKFIVENKQLSTNELTEKLNEKFSCNLSRRQVYSKIQYLKKVNKYVLFTTSNRVERFIYTPEIEKRILELKNTTELSDNGIREQINREFNINLNNHQISNKIFRLLQRQKKEKVN